MRIANYKRIDALYSSRVLNGGLEKNKYFWDSYSNQYDLLKDKCEQLIRA
ncbi:MAG: hypothetical protein PHW32_01145 [Bacilli bacterium]|nr:hypothetical protein [Bacilli bacterium]MDD4282907.1 hypothetical protein [Bacilli bacterium]MDD4719103.1 hypothetical protein [Bacilli bacterium]